MRNLRDVEIVPLNSYVGSDNICNFDCGEEKLNNFLKNDALIYENSFKACTQLVVSKNDGSIIAFYTCTITNIELSYKTDKELYTTFTNEFKDKDISTEITEPVFI